MNSYEYIFFFIDCNALFECSWKYAGKISIDIEINATDFILSGSKGKSEIEILIAIDSSNSTFFQGTYYSDSGRRISILESHIDRISSRISIFINSTENKCMLS